MEEIAERERSNPNDGELSSLSIPPWAKALLGYGAFAYAIGYIVIFLSAAKGGYLPPDLPQARVVWAGALPIFVMVCGVVLGRKLDRDHPPSKPLSSVQVAQDVLAAGWVTLLCVGFPYVLFWEVLFVLHQGGDDLIAARVMTHAVAFRVLVGLGYALYAFVGFKRLRKRTHDILAEDRNAYFRRYVIVLCVVALLLLFIGFGYSRLPMRFGFGAPSRVRLLISAEYAAPLFAEPSRGAEEKVRLTSPLDLLIKTDKEYVVRVPGGSSVVTIGSDGVKAVVWLP